MKKRHYIPGSILIGIIAGILAGILLPFLFSRNLLAAYAFSMLTYGIVGGAGALATAVILCRIFSPRWTLRITGCLWIAMYLCLSLAYWANKSLLAGTPFNHPTSIGYDIGIVMVSIIIGAILSWWITWWVERLVERGNINVERRLAGIGALLLSLPVLLLLADSASSPHEQIPVDFDPRPSVILISIDALRADHLGCYGYFRSTSPTVDRIASEGTLFRWAFCPVPSTSPSHASMLSGTTPQSHGVRENAYTVGDSVTTIAEILSREGYATAGFVTNFLLDDRFGFTQGFQTYMESGHMEKLESWSFRLYLQTLVLKEVFDKFMYRFRDGEDPAILGAKHWLGKNADRPFFLFLHLIDPHAPYMPREPFRSMFPHELPTEENLLWMERGKDPDKLARQISLYDGEIVESDRKLTELLLHLDKLGIINDLLIVYTADHGEYLGDHEPFFDHADIYDSATRVPLIFHYPGMVPAGAIFDQMVSNADIVPTILSVLKIPGPESIDGNDLIPLMRGRPSKQHEHILVNFGKQYALRTADWKVARNFRHDHVQLYDLKNDPSEKTDVLPLNEELGRALDSLLLKEVKRLEKGDYLALDNTSVMEKMDKQARERLRALGYLD